MENSSNIQLQNLPAEILTRIFGHLSFDERLRLERVSSPWRAVALAYAWVELRTLRFSREMLHIEEPWTDKRRIAALVNDLGEQQKTINAQLVVDYRRHYRNHNVLEAYEGVKVECLDCPLEMLKNPKIPQKFEDRLRSDTGLAMQEYKRILEDKSLYKRRRMSRNLGPLAAILRRCGPYLEELHLLYGIFTEMRFCKPLVNHLAPYGRLAHLLIEESLDQTHMAMIEEHFASQLISLSIQQAWRWRRKRCTIDAFKRMLSKCNKLETLRLLHFEDLFNKTEDNKFLPIVPPTLRHLMVVNTDDYWRRDDDPRWCLASLLAHCPHLRYFPLLVSSEDYAEFIGAGGPQTMEKFLSLQSPFFIVQNYFSQMQSVANFYFLKAIQLDHAIPSDMRCIAECCPQLVHLDFKMMFQNWDWGRTVDMRELEVLLAFRQLSSLAICMEIQHHHEFHELTCPDGEPADFVLLEILTKLNAIHPLRSLDFKPYYVACYYPSMEQEYMVSLLRRLPHLETFSCGFIPNWQIHGNGNITTTMDLVHVENFCIVFKDFLDGQRETFRGAQKSFKLKMILRYDRGAPESSLSIIWRPGSDQSGSSRMRWKCKEYSRNRRPWNTRLVARSVVLKELIEQSFGRRTSNILFDGFGLWEGEAEEGQQQSSYRLM